MKFDKVKTHIKDHKEFYIGLGIGVGLASITWVIMRPSQSIGISTGESAQSTIGVLGQKIVIKDSTLNTVSYISADRQGPASWVVRCLETGDVFTSQRAAANAMGLAQDHLSNHLNGSRENVDGFHFERICMAA